MSSNKNVFITETILPLPDVQVLKIGFNFMVIFTNVANYATLEFLNLIVPGCSLVTVAV